MGLIDKLIGNLDSKIHSKVNTEKTSQLTIVNPETAFKEVLKHTSGNSFTRDVKFDLFYQIFAFRGVVEGVGCSTLVANTAIAIADTGLSVCVIDTSIMKPVQDVLLKTTVAVDTDKNLEDALDWFDLPYTRKSPLHVSSLRKNISVLSFKGKHRTVLDFLSTNDSINLVEMALAELHTKFDIILIDCCEEASSVNIACLQQAHQVIQVWNDSPGVVANMENFITNSSILSCPLDKMRYVVYSKMSKGAMGSLDNLLKQYRCKHLATTYLSEEIYLQLVIGKPLYQLTSRDKDLEDFTNAIISIVCHILNIHDDKVAKGTFSSNDIMEGKVEGTYHKELKDFNDKFAEEHPDLVIDTNPMGYTDDGIEVEMPVTTQSTTEVETESFIFGDIVEDEVVNEGLAEVDISEEPEKESKFAEFVDNVKEAIDELTEEVAEEISDVLDKSDDKSDTIKKSKGKSRKDKRNSRKGIK